FPRPYYLVGEEPTEELLRFWQETPTTKPHNYGDITTSSTCGDLKIHRFPVDHSIYGASAWVVETNAGLVVYTGDLRCHGLACNYTWEFAKKVAELKPDVLITEGTRFDSQNTRTEEDVFHFALDEVKKAKSLVVADFGPRNIERLKIFLEIAKQTRRKLAILMKDAYLLKAMQLIDPNVPSIKDDSSIVIYSEFEANVANWKRSIREEYAEKLVRPQEVANNQDKFICCFSFFDVNELALIKPAPGSIWIYSSCEAFNEEMKIDLARLRAWLDKYEVPFLGGADDDQDNPFHVSGHACGTDLIELIKIIHPKNVIPIHIEERNLQKFKDSLNKITNVIVPELGKPIQI
ncbi:MAG: MBL fold metallo-hydrolase RNA specificity domain-containing protein, partial [Armatimonadota bacterium]|nr:MBL fold metallo-hydrolase RNA specificity domain-containing protein [Armatimonadota bacterium]